MRERLFIAGAVTVIGFAVGWYVNGWRWEARFNRTEQAHQQAREQAAQDARRAAESAYKAALEQEAAEARRAQQIASEMSQRAEAAEARAAKVKIVYRDAVKRDPDCAAWAAQEIRCPISSSSP